MSRLKEVINENLQQWMGASKAVDDTGEPLTLYHGSRSPWIVSFSTECIGSGVVGPGSEKFGAFWFSSNKETAEYYTDRGPKKTADPNESYSYGDNDSHYFLACDRRGNTIFSHGPYKTHELADEAMDEQIAAYNRKLRQDTYVTAVHLRMENPLIVNVIPRESEFDKVRAGGYDGIIARSVVDGHGVSDVYCVFSPSQIKAVDNAGAFSRLDDDIRDLKWLPQRNLLEKADKAVGSIKGLLNMNKSLPSM
jgi:hypothetical protein